jgi:hypothetical protein
MQFFCYIFGHKWSHWRFIRAIGRYDEKLDRKCLRCSKVENYVGLTEWDRTGKVPFLIKSK